MAIFIFLSLAGNEAMLHQRLRRGKAQRIWSAPAAGSPREHLAWGALDGAFGTLPYQATENNWGAMVI